MLSKKSSLVSLLYLKFKSCMNAKMWAIVAGIFLKKLADPKILLN